MKSRAWVAVLVLALASGVLAAGWWQALQNLPAVAGPVDIGFAQAMSRHHQQAIGMAQLMLDGRPTPLTRLAKQILHSQLLELGEMQGWLKLWGAPMVPQHSPMEWMLLGRKPPDATIRRYLLDCAAAPSGMAGLATLEDMERLRTLAGKPRDALFLKLMQAHHEGGLPMAQFAAAEATLPTVRRLAANVVREQSEEIFLLQRTQAALAASAGEPVTMPASHAKEEKPRHE
jgi:uncharacterized protein (DUF305 family)